MSDASTSSTQISLIGIKILIIGNFLIVQIDESTISKMETVQRNESFKDSVCSILEDTDELSKTNKFHILRVEPVETQKTRSQNSDIKTTIKKKWLKGPSTGSGTVRYNSLLSRFTSGVFVYG